MTIDSISDTAKWVAAFRAQESERPDAHFRDPYAKNLAGERGYQLARTLPAGDQVAWVMAVRTAVLDEMVLRAVSQGVDLVLNLACGLDTRPYRLPLPPTLHWVEADLPGILDYKEERLQGALPACRLERARADLARADVRTKLFERVGRESKKALVITEGLLVYLPEDAVVGLSRDLHQVASFQWWVIDLVSPLVLRAMQLIWNRQLAEGNARMQFGPRSGTDFFVPLGWREAEFRSFAEEGGRLRRGLAPRFWHLVKPFTPGPVNRLVTNISGMIRLERI
jgi:methyltransferase (TIGR00027 family)